MSYCTKRLLDRTSAMIWTACSVPLRKKLGISSVLIGSIRSLIRSLASASAAKRTLVEIIGEQIFDAAKTGSLGRRKAIDERHLREQHGEIGGKFGHGVIPYAIAR